MKIFVNDEYLFDGVMRIANETDVTVVFSEYENCQAHIQPVDDIAKYVSENFSDAEYVVFYGNGFEYVINCDCNFYDIEMNIRRIEGEMEQEKEQ